MQILIPLHDEEINSNLTKNDCITLSSNEIKEEYDNVFYAEIGKLLYASDHHLLNDKIIGFMQNRRILKNFELFSSYLNNSSNNIIVSKEELYGNSILDHFKKCHGEVYDIFLKSLSDEEIKFLSSKKLGSYHNIFVSSNEIFYDYANWLKNRLLPIYEECKLKNILNKKYGAWIAERLLILYIHKKNLNPIQFQMITYSKKK
jgi:hypothetical protein